jgi:hypothetical protein
MLRRVHYKWVSGVLEPSLAHAARLVLGLEPRPELLHLGTRIVHRIGHSSKQLSSQTPISGILDEVGGGLLVVGGPGAGKTTLLLQLCDELIDRAEHDLNRPIPVVFNLASWARDRSPIDDWLVDELQNNYQVPPAIAVQWLKRDALALLLDGLDEVAETYRAACAEALNVWRQEHGLVPMVICSRTHELMTLAVRLRLEEAVELQSPSDAEVDHYLGYLEITGTPIGDLRNALTYDNDLRQLLRSPLQLHIVALAYHGRSPTALYGPGTQQQKQSALWKAYVDRMFEQRPLDPNRGYTAEQAREWLGWLAKRLQDRDETEFHLDRLTPEWLSPLPYERRTRVTTGLVDGLVAGLGSGIGFSLLREGFGLELGLSVGLVFGIGAGLVFGLVGGLLFGLAGGLTIRVESAQGLRWSWSNLGRGLARKRSLGGRMEGARAAQSTPGTSENVLLAVAFGLGAGFAAGVVTGIVGGLAFGLAGGLAAGLGCGLGVGMVALLASGVPIRAEPTEQVRWSWSNLGSGLTRGLTAALIGGAAFGVAGWLAFGAVFGLNLGVIFGLTVSLATVMIGGFVGGLRDERAIPNEGTRRSGRHALVVGTASGLVSGMIFGLSIAMAGLVRESADGLSAGLGFGLVFGLATGLVFGGAAYLQHFVVRAWLVRENCAPWHYGRFLEAMAQRLLLLRIGSAYLFAHRLLRNYLADSYGDRFDARTEKRSDRP